MHGHVSSQTVTDQTSVQTQISAMNRILATHIILSISKSTELKLSYSDLFVLATTLICKYKLQ